MAVYNPKTLSWTNPTLNTDGTAYDLTRTAGYELQIDGTGAISIPLANGGTSFDVSTLAAYTALPAGAHTFALDIVTKEGVKSAFSTTFPFSIVGTPKAPTALSAA